MAEERASRDASTGTGAAVSSPAVPGADEQLTPRQNEIVTAAAEVFGEKDYTAGSMRDIAERVGVSEPALYRHFPGKRELFATMVRVLGEKMRLEASGLISAVGPEDTRLQLNNAIRERRLMFRRYARLVRVIVNTAATDPLIMEEFRRAVVLPLLDQVTAKAAELDMAFGVPNADATRADRVRAMLALVVGTVLTSFVLEDEPEGLATDAALRIMGWQTPSAV